MRVQSWQIVYGQAHRYRLPQPCSLAFVPYCISGGSRFTVATREAHMTFGSLHRTNENLVGYEALIQEYLKVGPL